MGCMSCMSLNNVLPPEVEEILKEVTKRGDEITEKFLIEEVKNKLKKKKY